MRPRRHVRSSGFRLGSSVVPKGWRRLARDLGLVALVFALGYVVSAVWVSPSPLFGNDDHAAPRVLGLPASEARAQLTALGLRPRVSGERPHPTVRAGTVIWQDPPPDVVLSPNSVVTLLLSAGPAAVPVPDVIGLDSAAARRILTAAGVKVGEVMVIARGGESGIVVGTRPTTGVARPRGARVDLVVSRGPEEIP